MSQRTTKTEEDIHVILLTLTRSFFFLVDHEQEVKTAACDKLLQARVDARMAGKKVNDTWLFIGQSYSAFFTSCGSYSSSVVNL